MSNESDNREEKSYYIANLISPEAMERSKEIAKDPERAKKFLQDAGILDDNGDLHENYRSPDDTTN